MLEKIISGGQTGADFAGLVAAVSCGIPTGGTAPKRWRICLPDGSDGFEPRLEKLGLPEHEHYDYSFRTVKNVKDSDGTVWFGYDKSAGAKLTLASCMSEGKPHIINPSPIELKEWVRKENIDILNVAGNRASKFNPDIFRTTYQIIVKAFNGRELPSRNQIWRHFKGGEYEIIGVSLSLEVPDCPVSCWAIDTETGKTLELYHHQDNSLTLTRVGETNPLPNPYVVYTNPHNSSSQVFARPVEDFMQILNDSSEGISYYRFAKQDI